MRFTKPLGIGCLLALILVASCSEASDPASPFQANATRVVRRAGMIDDRPSPYPSNTAANVWSTLVRRRVSTPPAVALIPKMTGASTPSGHVFSSGTLVNFDWMVFDRFQDFWDSSPSMPASIGYDWLGPTKTVVNYDIGYYWGVNPNAAPTAWTLQGWNGASWVTVDTRSGQGGWASPMTRNYTVASPGAYSKYQLVVSQTQGMWPYIVLDELQFYGY